MKILTAIQVREWDEYTIVNEPVASVDLMERAAGNCYENIIEYINGRKIKIFCAKGNNGGDGLALARMFLHDGHDVTVYILEFGAPGTKDFQVNLARLHSITSNIHFIQGNEYFPELNDDDIVIDALFGSGLNRPLEGISAGLVEHINSSAAFIISIDLPSGMFTDKSSAGNPVIKANITFTFQCLKLCFLMPENALFFGDVKVLDIGLHSDFLQTVSALYETIELNSVHSILKPRNPFAHKGSFGHALLIAGSEGKMGACLIAARACLRGGCGLLTAAPEINNTALNVFVPEAMTASFSAVEKNIHNFSAIGMGPGIEITAETITSLFSLYKKPMVIDAGAFTGLARINNWQQQIPEGSVLTPHPKEFDRLFGAVNNDFERMEKALKISAENKFIIVLKGHHTLIAKEGRAWFNTTGNTGLAKGGSGDMLTGMITSLLAQNYEPLHAAIFAVYWHGLTAGQAAETKPAEVILASDCIEAMGDALWQIINRYQI